MLQIAIPLSYTFCCLVFFLSPGPFGGHGPRFIEPPEPHVQRHIMSYIQKCHDILPRRHESFRDNFHQIFVLAKCRNFVKLYITTYRHGV